jgi:hypothetical protein
MNAMKRFRRSGAGASRGAQAERDAPGRAPIIRPPSVKLVMAEILARKFHPSDVAMPARTACPSIVNALFDRAAEEANARLLGRHQPKMPASRST